MSLHNFTLGGGGITIYLLSWTAICSGREGQEDSVTQEVQVGLETRDT